LYFEYNRIERDIQKYFGVFLVQILYLNNSSIDKVINIQCKLILFLFIFLEVNHLD
jgi:hypothetical protein